MNSLEEKLKYLKGLNNTITSLESDIINTLSENQTLSTLKNELEEHIKILKQENDELITTKNALTDTLSKKNKEILALKNEFLEPNNLSNDDSTISLGINNLPLRNAEAEYDALSFFDKKCPYCNEDLYQTTPRKKYEIDHFHPVVKGGQDVPWNRLPVCQSCNRKKRDILPHRFLNINTFKEVSHYLNGVKKKYLDEAIDSYTFKEKLGELIDKEYFFIRRNIHTDFISTLLYLADKHNIIEDGISYVEQKEHNETDRKTGKIIEYLDTGVPEDWENLNLLERRNFLEGNEPIAGTSKNLYQRDFVCIAEIWCECLGREKEDMDRYKTREINSIMKSLPDWKKSASTKIFPIYGIQRFYERTNKRLIE